MNAETYRPHPESRPTLVLKFFQNNPDEELSTIDIADKFSISRASVHSILRSAVEAGLLKRIRSDLGDYMYIAGPNLSAYSGSADAEDQKPAIGRPKSAPRRKLMNFEIKVESGVPFVDVSKQPGGKWGFLFDKLTENDQSVAIPIEVASAVTAAALKLNRGAKGYTYRVRRISDTQARVWRLAK